MKQLENRVLENEARMFDVFVLRGAGVVSTLTLRSALQALFHVLSSVSSCVLGEWSERKRVGA